MAIGCQKHGKTESYREYLTFVHQSSEQFIIAPGVKGMVMLVFTLPSFDRVFKVIKDQFAPQKEVSQARVLECYQLVKEHDRVGRMADTQEYENFVIDKHRISPELLMELQQEVPEKLEDLGDQIIIKHLYIERRMTPLNLYMEQADDQQLKDAIEEYGNAIKQLAAANIFPGDMLFKNFGVTRHGRVVFYDYDEICYMTEVNFRDIPLRAIRKMRWPASRGIAFPLMMSSRKSSGISYAATERSDIFLKRCTVIFSMPVIGGVCSSVSGTGMWRMFSPIGVSSVSLRG